MASRQAPAPDVAGGEHSADLLGLAVEMVRFITRNPGCAQSLGGTHERYTDRFRRFVLDLRRHYFDVTMAEFAAATDLPHSTVEDWLRGGRCGVDTSNRALYERATRGTPTRLT